MTQDEKTALHPGDIVRSKSGTYFVARILDGAPVLVRCFRMGNPANYEKAVFEPQAVSE